MTTTSVTLDRQRDGHLATVTLDRPPLNILDLDMLGELDAAFAKIARDPEIRLVVIRGGGGRAFSAGVAIEDHTSDKIGLMLERFHGALRRLFALEVPTVAAVDGHCLGGGMELAAVCDLVIATERSTFGQPEIKLACFPPVAAVLYPTLLGSGRTYDLLLTGRSLSCAVAHEMGFVARRVEDDLDDAVERFADEILVQSAAALRLTNKAIRTGERRVELFDRALAEAERIYMQELARTADIDEGVSAFLEKRPPHWQHR